MKYRLPGIYLGNISMDLLMKYMSSEDLSDQVTSNDYYQTIDRVENIKVFRVDFTFTDSATVPVAHDYNLYTYNIKDLSSIRETVRTYFTDIIVDPTNLTFDYNAAIDALVFSIKEDDPLTPLVNEEVIYANPILFDTMGQPSIYGTHMINSDGEHRYMISAKSLDGLTDLDSYTTMKQYADLPATKVKIFDLRYPIPPSITLDIDPTTLTEYSVDLLSGTDVNRLYFGKKTMLN